MSLHPENTPESLRYLTVEEAARLARCNSRTIRRAYESGRLRAFRPAHRVLLRESDVRAWIESQAAVEVERPRAPRARQHRARPGAVASLREIESQLSR